MLQWSFKRWLIVKQVLFGGSWELRIGQVSGAGQGEVNDGPQGDIWDLLGLKLHVVSKERTKAAWLLCIVGLVAPYRAILPYLSLRYPISRDTFSGRLAAPQMVRYSPMLLSFTQAHLCDTPFCNISREKLCDTPTKTSTKSFCDTIAASIARYEKYRCWASKIVG